jgi:hypothetical protein
MSNDENKKNIFDPLSTVGIRQVCLDTNIDGNLIKCPNCYAYSCPCHNCGYYIHSSERKYTYMTWEEFQNTCIDCDYSNMSYIDFCQEMKKYDREPCSSEPCSSEPPRKKQRL